MPLSYSQLSSYRYCPRKYEYEFVKKLPKALSPEQCFGISIHSCLAKFGNAEMRKYENAEIQRNKQPSLFVSEKDQTMNPELTLNELLAFWQTSFVTAGYDSTVAADYDRARGEKLLTEFYEWWKKEERKVIGIEKSFRCNVVRRGAPPVLSEVEGLGRPEAVINGRFDRVEELNDGTLRIIDFKTSRIRSQEEIDQDLQLSLYALAAKEEWKKEVAELVMLFLVDESLVEIVTTRGAGELKTAAKTIELLSERVLSGDYTPTPSREKCRGCPYRRICDVSASP